MVLMRQISLNILMSSPILPLHNPFRKTYEQTITMEIQICEIQTNFDSDNTKYFDYYDADSHFHVVFWVNFGNEVNYSGWPKHYGWQQSMPILSTSPSKSDVKLNIIQVKWLV